MEANLEGAKNLKEIMERLRTYANKNPDDKWILGSGWNYAMFSPDTLPNKKALDQMFPAIPVYLECYDGHTFWVNSKALALAGITKRTPNPANGEIVRDLSGEATGALKESAGALIRTVIPKTTEVEKLNALRAAIKWANQNGLARVHGVSGDFEQLGLFQELREDKQLSLRLRVGYLVSPPELRHRISRLLKRRTRSFTMNGSMSAA